MPRIAATARPLRETGEWSHLHCSFCGKDGEHVRFLAAGVAGAKICDACCLTAFFIFVKAYLTPRRWAKAR